MAQGLTKGDEAVHASQVAKNSRPPTATADAKKVGDSMRLMFRRLSQASSRGSVGSGGLKSEDEGAGAGSGSGAGPTTTGAASRLGGLFRRRSSQLSQQSLDDGHTPAPRIGRRHSHNDSDLRRDSLDLTRGGTDDVNFAGESSRPATAPPGLLRRGSSQGSVSGSIRNLLTRRRSSQLGSRRRSSFFSRASSTNSVCSDVEQELSTANLNAKANAAAASSSPPGSKKTCSKKKSKRNARMRKSSLDMIRASGVEWRPRDEHPGLVVINNDDDAAVEEIDCQDCKPVTYKVEHDGPPVSPGQEEEEEEGRPDDLPASVSYTDLCPSKNASRRMSANW